MIKVKKINNRGSTLIEILVYFAIIGVFTFVAITFAVQIMRVGVLSENYIEMQASADLIEEKIDRSIKEAESVSVGDSVFDNDEGVLVLNMKDGAVSPTEFSFLNGDVYMAQGVSPPVRINSERTKLTFFRFSRFTFPRAPDQLTLEAQLYSTHGEVEGTDKKIPILLTVSLRHR